MYNVIVLAEQPMSPRDAAEVTSLHEGIEEPRHYHVLIPCENAAATVETTLGTLATGEMMAAPPMLTAEVNVEQAQHDIDEHARHDLDESVAALRAVGQAATGEFSAEDPIDALERAVHEQSASEVIVMTRPHVVQEFLHLDWTSKARRRLGVPILHLLEHEPIDGEAGPPEGITGV
jgi:hypothetical protein